MGPCATIPRRVLPWSCGRTTGRPAAPRNTCRSDGQRCRSCAGRRTAVCWDPLDASPPGSVWWRAVNERLLRDGCEAVALVGGPGRRSVVAASAAVAGVDRRDRRGGTGSELHNASIVAAYPRSTASSPRQRARRSASSWTLLWSACSTRMHWSPARPWRWGGSLRLAAVLGDPRLGMAGVFLSLRRVLPNRYPLALDVERYIADEQRLGRLLDYAVIVPRLQRLYRGPRWSSASRVSSSWFATATRSMPGPSRSGHVWRPPQMPAVGRFLERATTAR